MKLYHSDSYEAFNVETRVDGPQQDQEQPKRFSCFNPDSFEQELLRLPARFHRCHRDDMD